MLLQGQTQSLYFVSLALLYAIAFDFVIEYRRESKAINMKLVRTGIYSSSFLLSLSLSHTHEDFD